MTPRASSRSNVERHKTKTAVEHGRFPPEDDASAGTMANANRRIGAVQYSAFALEEALATAFAATAKHAKPSYYKQLVWTEDYEKS